MPKSTVKKSSRLLLELLEDRLTPAWGSIPPALVPVPTATVSVVQDGNGDAFGNDSIDTNEVDWYEFRALTRGTYVFNVNTPDSDLNPVLSVYNARGSRLSFNNDAKSDITDSELSINLAAGQLYYFGITNLNGSVGGSYSWTMDGPAVGASLDDKYENNDSFASAFNFAKLGSSRTYYNLVMADAGDFYKFTTTAAGGPSAQVAINFQNSMGNLQLELYDGTGTLVATSATTDNSETISMTGFAAGTYTIRAYGQAGAFNPSYSMVITPGIAQPAGSGFTIQLSMSGLTTSQQAIFRQAASRWSQIIIGDIPDTTYQGQAVDDLLISASSVPIDGPNGILGQAGPDAFRSGSSLPIHGIMEFDTADLAVLESSGQLLAVVLHEMGHVLGIGTIWSRKNLLVGGGTENPRFIGAQATVEFNKLFNRVDTGVPVENSGGPGTRDAHWSESLFKNELMTGYLDSGVNPLSRVTVASLADMGYQVNINRADSYTPPIVGISAGADLRLQDVESTQARPLWLVSKAKALLISETVAMEQPKAKTVDQVFSTPAKTKPAAAGLKLTTRV
jgi:hypothetical protein